MITEIPRLSSIETRVLGGLIEKSITTPDYYPMTLNGLTAACNQKTSRYPVTDYSEQDVQQALSSLKGQSLVATAVGGGSRVIKYKHNFGTVFPVSDAAIAILCLLFLRGPQTPGELNTNSGRLYEFSSLDSVQNVLSELSAHEPPFVRQLQRSPGQKEARFIHLFNDPAIEENREAADIAVERRPSNADLAARVTELERQVALLHAIVAGLNDDSAE